MQSGNRRTLSDSTDEITIAGKDHRGDSDGELPDDDETVSIQLRGPTGDIGNKEQARVKKSSVAEKPKKLNRESDNVVGVASKNPRNRVASLPPKQNQDKLQRRKARSGTPTIARRNAAERPLTSRLRKKSEQRLQKTSSLCHVVPLVQVRFL